MWAVPLLQLLSLLSSLSFPLAFGLAADRFPKFLSLGYFLVRSGLRASISYAFLSLSLSPLPRSLFP